MDVPVGDQYFDCGGVKIGFEICEDAWVANRPGSELALRGVDVILNPSASHFAFDKFGVRQRFCIEGSRAFGVSYVYSNLLGNESGRVIFDGGAIIATEGRLAARGPRFSFRDVVVTTAVVDIAANRLDQARRGNRSEQTAFPHFVPFFVGKPSVDGSPGTKMRCDERPKACEIIPHRLCNGDVAPCGYCQRNVGVPANPSYLWFQAAI